MVLIQQVTQEVNAAIVTSPTVDPNADLTAGLFTLQWDGRLQLDATPATLKAWIVEWIELAEQDPAFIGTVGVVQYSVIKPWVAEGDQPFPFVRIYIPIAVPEGEVFNGFPAPPSSLVPVAIPLIAWMLIALAASTVAVAAVLILTPGQIRQTVGTLGLVLHPDSEVLQDIATEELPEDNVGEFFSTVKITVLALVAIVLIINIPKAQG